MCFGMLCSGENPQLNEEGGLVSEKLSKEELRERVVAAAKLANAHDFISEFPQGYDTDVGSSGSAMSGGKHKYLSIHPFKRLYLYVRNCLLTVL